MGGEISIQQSGEHGHHLLLLISISIIQMKTKSPVIALVDDDKIFQLTSAKIIRSV